MDLCGNTFQFSKLKVCQYKCKQLYILLHLYTHTCNYYFALPYDVQIQLLMGNNSVLMFNNNENQNLEHVSQHVCQYFPQRCILEMHGGIFSYHNDYVGIIDRGY